MIYKKCRRFYNGFNEFIINTVYDQIYLKIVMIYTVQRVYISYYEYDKKYICFGKRCDFIFKRVSVSKVTGTCIDPCIYIVAHISKVFTTLWIAPIM